MPVFHENNMIHHIKRNEYFIAAKIHTIKTIKGHTGSRLIKLKIEYRDCERDGVRKIGL